MPPINVEIERETLGSMLWNNSLIDEITSVVFVDDFFRSNHQIIFTAIRDLHSEGHPVDAMILADELTRRGELAKAGGPEELFRLVQDTPCPENGVYHAGIVASLAMTRRVIQVADKARERAYSREGTYEEQIHKLTSEVEQLSMMRVPRSVRTSEEVISGSLEIIKARMRGECHGLMTGVESLDNLIGGLAPGNLVVIGARPSMGKTAFALQILDHIARRKKGGVLLFSVEMDQDEIGERLLSMRSRIEAAKLKNPKYLQQADQDKLQRAGAELMNEKFWVDDSSVLDIDALASAARRYVTTHDVECIMVDYLGLLETPGANPRESRQEAVSALSRRFKRLAKELRIPIIVLSQLNRLTEQRQDHRPKLSDLRESGAVEQDANIVILLHRPEYYDPTDSPGVMELIVAKNRNGRVGTERLKWVGESMRFEELQSNGYTP